MSDDNIKGQDMASGNTGEAAADTVPANSETVEVKAATGDASLADSTATGDASLADSTATGDVSLADSTATGDASLADSTATGDASLPGSTAAGSASASGNNSAAFTASEEMKPDSPAPKKKKKHKGLKIAIIVVLAVIVACGGIFAYAYSTQKEYVQNKWAMITKNDTEYFKWVMDKNIAVMEDKFTEKTEKTKDIKAPTDWTDKGTLSVSLDPKLGGLFFGQNFVGVKNAGVKYELSSNKEKSFGALITPFYKNVDLLTAGVQAGADKKLYLALPSYRSEVIDLTSFLEKKAEEQGLSNLNLADIIDVEGYKKQLEDFRNGMNAEKVDKLIHIVYDKIDEATLEKDVKISVNGLEAEVNVLSGKLDKDKCSRIINEYLNEVFDNSLPSLIPDINTSSLQAGMDSPDGNTNVFLAGVLGDSNTSSLDGLLGKLGNLGDLGKILNIGSLGDIGGGLNGSLNSLSKSSIEKALAGLKEKVIKKLEEYTISADFSIYVDKKGDIIGGMIKLAVNETKIKIDTLKLIDKENKEKAQRGIDISLNGLRLGTILCNTEHKDGKKYFDAKIKLGTVIDMVLKGASQFEISAKGSITDPDPNSNELDFDLRITDPQGEVGALTLKNAYSGGSASMPLDTSESNVIDIMELADTDYIDLVPMLKPVIGSLDEINDEGLNNFLSGIMQDQLGLDMDVPELKKMIDTGMVAAGNSIVKDRLKKALGIEPPYDYSSLSEKVKESEDGNYLYSWDIFAEAPFSSVYDNLSVKVYDYYQRLDEFMPDPETEKNKFLSSYLGQTFAREAAEDEGIEMGDKVTFDVVPIIGSTPVESFAYPGEYTTIGTYEYGDGIDDQLLGVKKGQTLDLTLTLDDRYGAFAGYTGVFRITVTDITKYAKPEWSEEFIVGQLGYESLEALETQLMDKANQDFEELYSQYAPTEEGLKAVLIDRVTEKIDISSCGDESKESALKYQESLTATAGSELSDIYKAAGYSDSEILKLMGVDKSIPDYAVRRRVMDEVAVAAGNLTVSKADYESFVDQLASALGYSDEASFMESVGNKYGQRFFVDMLVDRTVTDMLYEKAYFDWN